MKPPTHGHAARAPELTPDQRAFRASLEGLVDFYRVAQAAALWRAFWPAAFVFLPAGSLLTAVAMTDRWVRGPLQSWLVALAIAVTASGPLWAIVVLLRSIQRDDCYVAIFLTGLRLRLEADQEPRHIPWEELQDVSCDERGVRLSLTSGELVITKAFAALSAPELALRIRDARRLAVWGRLTPRSFTLSRPA
jgi:Bacterial PH domain